MQRYQMVSQNDIETIHETSLKLMEDVGIIMPYERALEVLKKGGAKVDGQTVHFPRDVVEKNIKNCPSSYTMYGRNPDKNVEINTHDCNFAGPYGAASVLCADKGRRPGTMQDFINFAKLCQMLDNINIQSHIYAEPQEVDVKIRHIDMMYNAMKYNEKPLMGSVMGYEHAKECIEISSIAFGGLEAIRNKPIMASIPCTLTPLSYDPSQLGAVFAYSEYGQVQLMNSLCLAGATTPATLAGTVALQNAEILAGIVLSQLINPGTPIVYSASGSCADMRTGALCVGAPEDSVMSLINGQLAKFYNLPCRISGGLSDSKCVDAQAGYESMMTLMSAQMAGGNFILHGAGILEAYNCVSYEKLILDNEIIGMVRRLGRGIEINEKTLAYDVIKEVGPQGAFINHKHTAKNCRKEFYSPALSDRNTPERWNADGALTAEQRANKKWKTMLDEYVEPALPADVEKDMVAYIEKRR